MERIKPTSKNVTNNINIQNPQFDNYLDKIFNTSFHYLSEVMTNIELQSFVSKLKTFKYHKHEDYVCLFNKLYCEFIKNKYQLSTTLAHNENKNRYWG